MWKRGRVQGVCERPLPTLSSLTHHLHSPTCTCPHSLASPAHCPLSTGDCPLPSAHWPLPSRSQAGRGRGRVPSLLPPLACTLLAALPCSLPAPELHTPQSWPLRLSLSRHSGWVLSPSPPSLLSCWSREPGVTHSGPFTKGGSGTALLPVPLGHRMLFQLTCRHVVPGRPSGALQDLRRRPTGEGDGTRTPTRQHVPFGVLLQMGSWAETAPASAGTWRLAHWLTGGHGAQGHARCSWGAGNDEGQWG